MLVTNTPFLAMVCDMDVENCTLFQTKLCDCPYFITDQSQKNGHPIYYVIVIARISGLYNYYTTLLHVRS